MRRNSTVSFVDHSDPEPITESLILDGNSLTDLLNETNHTMKTYGVDLEDPNFMTRILGNENTAQMYIDSLAEGLNPEDTRNFKHLANNMLDEMNLDYAKLQKFVKSGKKLQAKQQVATGSIH